MRDKRILPAERASDGACAVCKRRHIHTDDCLSLKRREDLTPRSRTRYCLACGGSCRGHPGEIGGSGRDRRIESGL